MKDSSGIDWDVVIGFVIIGGFFALYFLPTFTAKARRHRNRMAIFVLNLAAGWTIFAWFAAMVWACTNDTEL